MDIKRVVTGSPWSFNRKALVIKRMSEGDIPRVVNLIWIQIHELRVCFMTEKVVKELGNFIGTFIESYPSNFTGVWRKCLLVESL